MNKTVLATGGFTARRDDRCGNVKMLAYRVELMEAHAAAERCESADGLRDVPSIVWVEPDPPIRAPFVP